MEIKISEFREKQFREAGIVNVKEFVKLIETYDSITYQQLKNEWYNKDSSTISNTLERISGWGNHLKCTLCVKVYKYNDCNKCVWSVLNSEYTWNCINQTYKNIGNSEDLKELWIAIQRRKNEMIKLLNSNLNTNNYEKSQK